MYIALLQWFLCVFVCKLDGSNMTLRVSKGKEELPGWADNIDFDQDWGKRNTERERENARASCLLQDIKLSSLPQIKITTLDGNENFN